MPTWNLYSNIVSQQKLNIKISFQNLNFDGSLSILHGPAWGERRRSRNTWIKASPGNWGSEGPIEGLRDRQWKRIPHIFHW